MPHLPSPGHKGSQSQYLRFPVTEPPQPFCSSFLLSYRTKASLHTYEVAENATPFPPGPHPAPCRPGPRGARTCPSAIFGSRLGKKEALAQGFLSLATGAEEMTPQGLREQLSVVSLATVVRMRVEVP